MSSGAVVAMAPGAQYVDVDEILAWSHV